MTASSTDQQLAELFLGRDTRPDPMRLTRLLRWVEFRNDDAHGRRILTHEMATQFRRKMRRDFSVVEATSTETLVEEFNQWLVDVGVNSLNVFNRAE